MGRPTGRVLQVLEVLQSGGTHPVRELADRLQVDERTVRRYVEHLVDLDVPVVSVRGRHGGYRLAPGYRLPPLMLSDDEALAVLLGLAVLRRSGLARPAQVDAADAKVRRVLPARLARRLAGLLASVAWTGPARAEADAGSDVLLLLADAARERRVVQMAYRSASGHESARTLEPYGVVAHRGRWMVTGRDSASGEIRTFRVDRVTLPRVLQRTFTAPAEFDAAEHVLTGIASAPYRHRVRARVQGTVDELRAALPPGVATVRPARGGWSRVEINAESLDWVPGVLAGLGRPFEVEEPAELRVRVRDLAVRVAELNG